MRQTGNPEYGPERLLHACLSANSRLVLYANPRPLALLPTSHRVRQHNHMCYLMWTPQGCPLHVVLMARIPELPCLCPKHRHRRLGLRRQCSFQREKMPQNGCNLYVLAEARELVGLTGHSRPWPSCHQTPRLFFGHFWKTWLNWCHPCVQSEDQGQGSHFVHPIPGFCYHRSLRQVVCCWGRNKQRKLSQCALWRVLQLPFLLQHPRPELCCHKNLSWFGCHQERKPHIRQNPCVFQEAPRLYSQSVHPRAWLCCPYNQRWCICHQARMRHSEHSLHSAMSSWKGNWMGSQDGGQQNFAKEAEAGAGHS